MTTSDLRQRLRRIGVMRHTPRSSHSKFADIQNPAILSGRVIKKSTIPFQLVETVYPIDESHGHGILGDLLRCSLQTASLLSYTDHSGEFNFSRLAFLDIETTGLSGGAGTLAFLVGIGSFSVEGFILRQFFLSDPADELGMLTEIAELLDGCKAVATFNGRSFDIPMLESRFMLNRIQSPFACLQQLDLLPAARRLWRGRTTGCSLNSLEQEVLGVVRSGDVAGCFIPRVYVQYLQDGVMHGIRRVMDHNSIDILSMVVLATRLLETFDQPWAKGVSGSDCLRVGLWLDTKGLSDEAENAYWAALQRSLTQGERLILLRRFAAFLKRANRRVEAMMLWEQLADLTQDDPDPCVEIAKYFEWHTLSLQPAIEWTERAIRGVKDWSCTSSKDVHLVALNHRLQRLERKMDSMMAQAT